MSIRESSPKPWTKSYQRTITMILRMLSSPEYTIENSYTDNGKKKRYSQTTYLNYLRGIGVIKSVNGGKIKLNIDKLKEYSVVVDDELYDNLRDRDWLREQRKKLGLIKGEIKDDKFREGQAARKRAKAAYARQQRAKRLAQPSEDLPLSGVLFTEPKD